MASNRQRQKVSRYLWGALNRLSHRNAHLEDDPQHRVYDLSKFGIYVEMINRAKADELRSSLIEELKGNDWVIEPIHRHILDVVATKPDSEVRIIISSTYWTAQEEGRFRIGVH